MQPPAHCQDQQPNRHKRQPEAGTQGRGRIGQHHQTHRQQPDRKRRNGTTPQLQQQSRCTHQQRSLHRHCHPGQQRVTGCSDQRQRRSQPQLGPGPMPGGAAQQQLHQYKKGQSQHANVQAGDDQQVARARALQHLPVGIGERLAIPDQQGQQALVVLRHQSGTQMPVQSITPLPQGRRSRVALPAPYTTHSTDTLGVQPSLVIKCARVAHASRSTQTYRQLPLLARTDGLSTPPVQAHQRQALAIQTTPITQHEAPSGLGLFRQGSNGPDQLQRLVIQMRCKTLTKLPLMPGQRPARAQRKDQEQPTCRPATQ